jgi:hypothetical protein
MKRRLRIAGTAFGALLVPACTGLPSETTAINPTATNTKAAPPIVPPTQAAKPRSSDKFGDLRGDAPPPLITTPTTPASVAAAPAPPAPPPSSPPVAAPAPTIQQTKAEQPADSPKIAPPPIVMPDFGKPAPPPEPVPDAEGVIRPSWPVIKGAPAAKPNNDEPKLTLPTPGDLPPAAKPVLPPDKAPTLTPGDGPTLIVPPSPTPPILPPGVIGSTTHQANASPAGAFGSTDAETIAEKPVVSTGDTPLIRAVRAFQENKPDEAVEHLKAYDPATQQILLSLLPALGRLGDGELQQMKPAEMDALLDQLTKVPNMLRPRASLQANNVRLCREVHNFAHVEPFPERHTFRSGDIVYLYMELANFSCVPVKGGGYAVTLASSLELKDTGGNTVWRADPKEVPDQVSSPPQDYYRNFRLSVPNVPPGSYTLVVKTTDRPTGREVQKAIELRIGDR